MEEQSTKSSGNILYTVLLFLLALAACLFFLFSGVKFPTLDFVGLTFGIAFVACWIGFMRPHTYHPKGMPLIASWTAATGWFAYLTADYLRQNRKVMSLFFASA